MNDVNFSSLNVGDELPPLALPPVSRQTLAIYCGASGDHNPVHVDIDFAKASGLDDVIAHGMLVMAYMGRSMTNWMPQSALRRFDTRFQAMTHIGDEITVNAKVVEKFREEQEDRVRIEVQATDQHGQVKAAGGAIVGFPNAA